MIKLNSMDIGSLDYYILGEFVTCVLSAVLCANILSSFTPTERKHRLFLIAGVASFLSPFSNILSVFCISFYDQLPLPLCTIVTSSYFFFVVLVPVALSAFSIEYSFAYNEKRKYILLVNRTLLCLWGLFLIINVKTGWLFKYSPDQGYVRGPLKNLTYAQMGYYTLVTVTSVLLNKKSMPDRIFFTFIIYPFVTAFFVMLQFFLPKVIMTGAASFSGLLMTYLTIQSDLLEFDNITGLLGERKLQANLEKRKDDGFLYVLNIGNFAFLQDNMPVSSRNQLLLDLANEFSSCFQRQAYLVSAGRFAGICEKEEDLNTFTYRIYNFILQINTEKLYDVPAPLEVQQAAIEFVDSESIKNYSSIVEIINTLLEKGRNNLSTQIQLCNESVLMEMERKKQIYNILKRELTLESEHYQVWFQPIYSIAEKKFTYMEALSRLNGTELGNIPPGEFVEVAEHKGLIEKLGFVAFQKICKFIAENKDVVPAVSVNFSGYQMANPNLLSIVMTSIARFGLSPENIIMEITESCFIDDTEIVMKNMMQLSNLGIRFYLDDFGTGYSNLSSVVNLPFNTVKMDRSFVLMMEDKASNVTLFRNLVSTFKGANLKILVEGVETQEQNLLVCESHVDYIQGYLYSKPLSPSKCIELLKNQ